MLPELDLLYRSMETRKAEMLTHLATLSHEERNRNPKPSEWSPLQVMDHLVLVEEWMSCPNRAVPPKHGKVLLKGRLFIFFGGGIMRSRFRIPTIPMAVPQTNLDFAEIERRWDDARGGLALKLAAITTETQSLPIALHPIAGPLNGRQVLELLDVHLAYHVRHFPQVK